MHFLIFVEEGTKRISLGEEYTVTLEGACVYSRVIIITLIIIQVAA